MRAFIDHGDIHGAANFLRVLFRRGKNGTRAFERQLRMISCDERHDSTLPVMSDFAATECLKRSHFFFHRPTVFPSGSCIQAKVPVGMSTGGTSVFPPSNCTLSTST